MYQSEAKQYQKANTVLKGKLLESVSFLAKTISIDPEVSEGNILHKTLRENEELKLKLDQINQENQMLRSFVNLNLEYNSYKSFKKEIKKLEDESQQVKGLSPSRKQEDKEKDTTKSILKRSIRDKYKRSKRKRTESFHYSEFGETSPDDDEEQNTTLNKLRRKSLRVNEFSSGYSMQAMETLQKQAEEEKANESSSDDSSDSSSPKSVKEEEKEEEKEETKKVEEEKELPQEKVEEEKNKFDRRAKLRQDRKSVV